MPRRARPIGSVVVWACHGGGGRANSGSNRRGRVFRHEPLAAGREMGRKAVSRLCGPEAGVTWTAMAALGVVQKVLAGYAPPGFQTPARAFGADFALEGKGVTREEIN